MYGARPAVYRLLSLILSPSLSRFVDKHVYPYENQLKYTYVCIHMHTYLHATIGKYVCICICILKAFLNVSVREWKYIRTCLCIHMHLRVYICI